MSKPLRFASLLLFSSALIAPAIARAQAAPSAPTSATPTQSSPTQPTVPDQGPGTQTAEPALPEPPAPDVSIPGGGDIVVTGSRNRNVARTTSQVVSVLSSADIARTGEGDIAGSLSRVTGLSVVGNGFVYVRGLGDRYSLALLNGSPLPSPEPLRRVVPLDIFPTSVIASSLVQKSYSVNFPGEFGGGVINLTTKAVPATPFLSIGAGIGVDTFTTGQLGYTYFGSSSDWTGFDNGQRNNPPLLKAFLKSGRQISDLSIADNTAIAAQLINGRNAVIQRSQLPPNWSGTVTGGKSFDLGGATFGVIATAGYSNKWRTRETTQQTANALDLSNLDRNFDRVITDDRLVVNGLLGLSLEFGPNKIRQTTLYIRDTLKQSRLGVGTTVRNFGANVIVQEQDTAWFERQLINTQFVGEFKPLADVSVDLRGSYANTQRESPNEIGLTYSRLSDGTGLDQFYSNSLGVGARPNGATIGFSDLDENLYSGGVDLTYKPIPGIGLTVGYAYSDTKRRTEVREFAFRQNGQIPQAVTLLRPDLLLGSTVVTQFPGKDFYVRIEDNLGGNPTFDAKLRNHGAYAQIQAQVVDGLSVNAGVRYETAKQTVTPVQVYTSNAGVQLPPPTNIDRSYWLPAATITYQINPEMQLRLSGSKTIARPQFRELVFQTYFDPETNTAVQGNPLLVDSQLYNGEARYEWYFARDQRISVSGFYKRIDHPIEVYADDNGNSLTNRFANAPKADLYGAEIETQKYFGMDWLSDSDFFSARRVVIIANYTYTKSKILVGPNDPVSAFPFNLTNANQLFRNGSPLTGQSDHLVNVQLGLEDKTKLSQQTLLLSYASKRVTRRGPSGQPDIAEQPGLHLDFVARQGVKLAGLNTEMKFEVRNITGTKYQEFQQSGANRVYYNRYDVGRVFNFGLSVNF